MFNIFYKKPLLYKKINGFSNQNFLKFNNKIILDKLERKNENILFLNDNIAPQPNRNINIDIFIFLSISYFMYIKFYYSKYKYINI
jgi:hypothetical protein